MVFGLLIYREESLSDSGWAISASAEAPCTEEDSAAFGPLVCPVLGLGK